MGKAIKHRWPEIESYVFYMDIQNFGKDFLPLYEEARESLTLIRAIPGSISPAPGERIALGFQAEGGGPPREEIVDLLILSVGLMPAAINETWKKRFQMPLNEDGFLIQPEVPGLFAAGTITGPLDIAQSIAQGGQAARRVAGYLGLVMK